MDKEKYLNNELFKKLPEETKEKLLNCTSEEEAMEILKGEMIPISDEELDAVAGGICHGGTCSADCEIDDD